MVKTTSVKCSKLLDNLAAVGLSLALCTCVTCQVLLAAGQLFFLGDFVPHNDLHDSK